MAVSSTSSNTSGATNAIDVAGIVSQLMTYESKPLDAIKAKLSNQSAVISDLGIIKSKMATFQDAIKTFQYGPTFNTASVTNSDATVLTASVVNGAAKGSHSITVNSVATQSFFSLSGYSSETSVAGIGSGGFTISVGGNSYNSTTLSSGLNSSSSIKDLAAWINSLGANFQASVVQMDAAGTNWSLKIQGTETGSDNAVTYRGLNTINTSKGTASSTETAKVEFAPVASGKTVILGGLTFTAGSSGATAAQLAAAFASITDGTSYSDINVANGLSDSAGGVFTAGTMTDWSTASVVDLSNIVFTSAQANTVLSTNLENTGTAIFSSKTVIRMATNADITFNGESYSRQSNSISDIVDGLTFQLLPGASNTNATITISAGENVAKTQINTLITAYNDLMSSYKTMTANSYNSKTPGSFASSPSTLSFIGEIKNRFAKGISYELSGEAKTISLSTLGIDLQVDGTAKFNQTSYDHAVSNDLGLLSDTLQTILAKGVYFSTNATSTGGLDAYITSQTGTSGAVTSIISYEQETIWYLEKQQAVIQTKLDSKQAQLISQYSALNTLLFQLSSTSNALTSALDALNKNTD
jgi:flagellar hook-associated protein 2